MEDVDTAVWWLKILSALIVLPAVAAIVFGYFRGWFRGAEDAKYVVLAEDEPDHWADESNRYPRTGQPARESRE